MLFKVALGYAIRTERYHLGLTLRQVSKKANIALGYLSEVERGQKELSSEFIESVAHALNISTAQLIQHSYEVLEDWEEQVKEKVWDSLLIKT